jgi:hypothetical protein
MSKIIENFYKATLSLDWSIGTGNFYVSTKPTVTDGWLVISPNNSSIREIVRYTSTGTDANGDYIVITVRGVGGTTEQIHTVGEPIRMNITAEYWAEMTDDIANIVESGVPNANTTTMGGVEIATDAEVDAGTETGSTGASLALTPKNVYDSHNIPHVSPSTSGNIMTANGTDWVSSPLLFTCGATTYELNTASGVQNIAHGLGAIPKNVKITAVFSNGNGNFNTLTVYNGTTQSSLYQRNDIDGTTGIYGALFRIYGSDGNDYQSGVVTFDATNIIITWTKTGSPSGASNLMWEAQ